MYIDIFNERCICNREDINFNMTMIVSIDARAINKMYQICYMLDLNEVYFPELPIIWLLRQMSMRCCDLQF